MNSIRHVDLEIEEQEPFKNCVLGRKKYAEVLTSIITSYADGFVLALNNEWGAGKTTFVRMWQQQMKNEGFQTLYFNAWENDFDANPLVALMAELQELVKPQTSNAYKGLIKRGAVVAKKIIPHLAKSLAKRYFGDEAVAEFAGDSTEAATEILSDEINDFASKKQGLKEFRECLSDFVEATSGDNPLVFIIDELDRCRPNYAVELLEQVKHFFSVPGIVFVLSIDKVQLGNAIRGFYGNEQIDANEYLRRFLDLEFSLPQPDNKGYCDYLYQYFDFSSFFSDKIRLRHHELQGDGYEFLELATKLLEKEGLTLRQYEKIFSHARVGLRSFSNNNYLFPRPYFLLTFIRIQYPDFFKCIKNRKLTLDQLGDELKKIFPSEISSDDLQNFASLEAQIIHMYNRSYSDRIFNRLIIKDDVTGAEYSIVKSKVDTSEGNSYFVRALKHYSEGMRIGDVGIDCLVTKIDLLESIIASK